MKSRMNGLRLTAATAIGNNQPDPNAHRQNRNSAPKNKAAPISAGTRIANGENPASAVESRISSVLRK